MTKQVETAEQVNARVLATVTVDKAYISRFTQFTGKAWPTKFAGTQPSEAMLMVAAAFAKSNHAVSEPGFLAMLLRDSGSTDQQHNTGFNCRNAHNFVWHHATGLTSLGYFKREQLGKGCWRVSFTPKGEKYLAKRLAELGAVAALGNAPADKKPAKKAKAKKAKAAPAVTATVEAAPLPDQVPVGENPTGAEVRHTEGGAL